MVDPTTPVTAAAAEHRAALRERWLDSPKTLLCQMNDGAIAMLIIGPSDDAVARGDWRFGLQVSGEPEIRWRQPEELTLVDGVIAEVPRDKNAWLSRTRLVEEEPHVEDYRYYLWSGRDRKTVWKGMTKAEGEQIAAEIGLTIDVFEPYEP